MNKTIGTFLGVYTPTVLTILGVIMYLRFGWLVGHLGLLNVLAIVLLAHVITITTTLSFSSVATNGRVGIGGAYYIISRSLGLEVGGSIGFPLFLSQTFSITLYAFGLAESLRFVFPGLPLQPVAAAIIILVAGMSLFGAQKALKAQVPLMIIVGISIVALGIGAALKADTSAVPLNLGSGEVGFWVGFAIFFPAVTGAMAGLGLSGDLKDPGYSIPRGALLAVGTGLIVYLLIPVGLAVAASTDLLRNDFMVWTKVAVGGSWLVLPGLWSAIFSSAVGSMLGAPRTLQALARDRLAPRLFAGGGHSDSSLIPGLVFSTLIALAVVMLGDLNAVARVVSMFFLTVYGAVNFVAAFESISGDPSWRPRLNTHWAVNLVGGFSCLAVMFLIDPLAGAIALVAEVLLFLLLSRHEKAASWGDARRGLLESLIRWALVRLAARPISQRNWRPHPLVFVDDPVKDIDLARYANWFSNGKGVVTTCQLHMGNLEEPNPEVDQLLTRMREVYRQEKLVVFPEVDVVTDLVEGIVSVSQANGMAGLTSNTVVMGWPDNPDLQAQFVRAQRQLDRLNKSMVIGRIKPHTQFGMSRRKREIHVWWGGLQRNGDLMLLLAYLLGQNPEWRDAQVRIMSVATNDTMAQQTRTYLEKMLGVVRIQAEFEIILKPEDKLIREIVQENSARADIVFLGMALSPIGKEMEGAQRLEQLAGDLPCVFFVHNASLFTGDLLDGGEFEDVEEVVRPSLPDGRDRGSTDHED
jgi:amino acid transporter|nr:Na-K-Cl cotransporter [Candidatus Krumholzibacteria bacterium]